jgi:deoxyribodipyrimidine photo-lyase
MQIKHPKDFTERDDYVDYLRDLFPNKLEIDDSVSYIQGGLDKAERKLDNIKPASYCKNRNFINGDVTRLSPYIRHGVLTLKEVLNKALEKEPDFSKIEKFIQELAWRDFWQRIYQDDPNKIWNNIEDYKTGYHEDDYKDKIDDDIANGETGVAVIDTFLQELIKTGYIHNHGRMYLASYICHFRRIKWQTGAKFFLTHLLDGDPASNNLSFQWVASTFSNKPYIFNLENAQKYCGDYCDTSTENNQELNFSYEELSKKLFPNNNK